MELIKLSAKSREKSGKGAARRLRQNNFIPAITYGAKAEPCMIALDTAEFDRVIRKHGTMGLFFNLKIDGDSGKEKIVMLKDVQMDTFGLKYLHVDLHEIDMDEKVTVTVPVETTGTSKGVKEGGLLQIIRHDLDVQCKPTDKPAAITIDITDLGVGDAVHVEDIDLGEDVVIPHEVNFTVVTVIAPTVDEQAEEEEEELEEEIAETAAPSEE